MVPEGLELALAMQHQGCEWCHKLPRPACSACVCATGSSCVPPSMASLTTPHLPCLAVVVLCCLHSSWARVPGSPVPSPSAATGQGLVAARAQVAARRPWVVAAQLAAGGAAAGLCAVMVAAGAAHSSASGSGRDEVGVFEGQPVCLQESSSRARDPADALHCSRRAACMFIHD